MRRLAGFRTYIAAGTLAFAPLLAIVYAAERRVVIPFQKVSVNTDELIGATGLNIYKFQVDMPKGQGFRVILRSLESRDSGARELHSWAFTKDGDAPTTLLVSFLRRDGKLGGVLLSQEEEAEYRLDCPGCTPSGIATIVPLPLAGTNKTLFVHRSDKDNEHFDGLDETRLITVVRSELGEPAPPPTSYPRVELVVQREQ